MTMKRVSFTLPYKVKAGTSVMNQLGREVGLVVEVDDEPHDGHDGHRFNITADVKADTDIGTVQVLEPTFPV